MKTADKMKCESIEKTDEKPGFISGSTLVENNQKKYGSYGSINFDDGQIFIKPFGDEYIQMDAKSSWSNISKAYRAMVENANDGICIVLENMRHAYVNRKYCEITGYTGFELDMLKIVELISTEEREAFRKTYQRSFHNETNLDKNLVATMIRKDGKRCSIEYSRSKIVWKGKPAIQGIIRDITEYLEKERIIKTTNKLLSNRIENITAELMASSEKLKQKHSELIRHKSELENVNKELLQTNRAMSVLARNIVEKKKEVEQKIANTVLTKIIPIINELKKKKAIQKYIAELEVLSVYVNGIAPETDQYNKMVVNLSATEMRIATLIKNGMSSQGIADALHISIETVKTHRKKIRRKLEIKNSDANLTSYLRSLSVDS